MEKEIDLIEYTPLWNEYFAKECHALKKVLRSNLDEAHHIGSTAVIKTIARPILDVLCLVHTLDGVSAFIDEFKKVGLKPIHENKIPESICLGRFSKDGDQISQVLILEKHNPSIDNYLDIKNYLNAEESVALELKKMKLELKNEPMRYQQGKQEFFRVLLEKITK